MGRQDDWEKSEMKALSQAWGAAASWFSTGSHQLDAAKLKLENDDLRAVCERLNETLKHWLDNNEFLEKRLDEAIAANAALTAEKDKKNAALVAAALDAYQAKQEFETERHDMLRTIGELRKDRARMLAGVEQLMVNHKVSIEEMQQLNLGVIVKDADGKSKAFVPYTLEDAKQMLMASDNDQAAVARFRQLKQHFVTHQRAVSFILDRIRHLTQKNRVTAKDVKALRDVRHDLESLIGRAL
jgi:hypothetical protein